MPDIFNASKPISEPQEETSKSEDIPLRPPFEAEPLPPPMQQPQPQIIQQPSPEVHTPQEVQKPHEPTRRLSSSLPESSEGSAPGLFSSYSTYPIGIKFINQEPNERLVLFLRRHFITNVPWIILTVLFLFVPPLYFAVLTLFDFRFFEVSPQMTFVLVSFYYLVVLNYALGKFIVWFYHVGVVTQNRLLDLDVDNILHYHLAETELGDVVDVSYSEKGFFQSFFNFGEVHMQTEAIKANFVFEQTPKPAQVADIITDLRPELKHK